MRKNSNVLGFVLLIGTLMVSLLESGCPAGVSSRDLQPRLLGADSVGASLAAVYEGQSYPATLTGTNFTSVATVNVGPGISATNVSVLDSTTINLTLNVSTSATPGNTNITVTTQGGTSNSLSYTVFAPPTITGISPSSLAQGATGVPVVVNGTNFFQGATVNFGPTTGITTAGAQTVNSAGTAINFNVNVTTNAPTGPQIFTVNTGGLAVPSGSVTLNVTTPTSSCTPAQNNPCGNYHVNMDGSNIAGRYRFYSNLRFDGTGDVNGIADISSVGGSQSAASVTGKYSCGSNNLCLLNLTAGSQTYTDSFALNQAGTSGSVISFDGVNQASGQMWLLPSSVNLAQINGPYLIRIGDIGMGVLGAGTADGAGNVSGTVTTNTGGTVKQSQSLTATISSVDPATGRGTGTLNWGSSSRTVAVYPTWQNASGIARMVYLATIDQMTPTFSGEMALRMMPSGGWNTAFTCPPPGGCVAAAQGSAGTTGTIATVAQIQLSSTPGVVTANILQNDAGTFTSTSNPATYTLDSNGVGFIGGLGYTVLINTNEAKTMSADSTASFGYLTAGSMTLPNGNVMLGNFGQILDIQQYAGVGLGALPGGNFTVNGSLFSSGGLMTGSGITVTITPTVNPTTGIVTGTTTAPWLSNYQGFATSNGLFALPTTGNRPIVLKMGQIF